MPIKGLSERRRIPRIAKIHLGIKVSTKDGKNQYPKATDFFVLPMREGSGDAFLAQAIRYRQAEAALGLAADSEKLAEAEAAMRDARLKIEALMEPIGRQISAVYGPMPRELDILFPSEKIEECFPQNYKSYTRGAGLYCRGDGTKAMRLDAQGAMQEIECLGRECPLYIDKKCTEMANLMVMLPRVSIGGCFQIDTGSINSIIDVNSGFDQVRAHVGRSAMVPCKLRVVRRQATAEGKKKNIYTLQVGISSWDDCRSFAQELVALRKEFNEGLQLPAPQQAKFEESHLIQADTQSDEPTVVLPGGERVDASTGEIIEGEFEPEGAAGEGERTADDLIGEAAEGEPEAPQAPKAKNKAPKADLWPTPGQPPPETPPEGARKALKAGQKAPKPSEPLGRATGVDF